MSVAQDGGGVRFPGIPATVDGSEMAAWVETHVGEVACAYPITSSQTMAQGFQAKLAQGHLSLWGRPLSFLEPESEHSAQSACEGAALGGSRVVNFTSGQGLILMKEVLYVISGKRLPMVLHVGARALTSQALNVHCGHDDVAGVADVGWGILFARNVQDVGDLSLVARRVSEEAKVPFMVVQDGFLTTHTIETCRLPEPDLMREYVGDPRERLECLLDPARPVMSGVVQNQDAYMKGKVAQRDHYDRLPGELRSAMDRLASATGRPLAPVVPYRMEDARFAVVCMGTLFETATAAVDHLRQRRGIRAGAVHVTSLRPFPGPDLARVLSSVEALSVLERLDTPLSQSNPLTVEVKAALADAASGRPGYPSLSRVPPVASGIAGLGGRDVDVSHLVAAFENLAAREAGPERMNRVFALGVKHRLAIEPSERPDVRPEGAFAVRGHSIGGWGSITTNKVMATLIGELFGVHVQAFPKYGSEKKGMPTSYFLTLAREPIRTHQELHHVDFISAHDPSVLAERSPLSGLREGGWVYLQTEERDPARIAGSLPAPVLDRMRRLRATLLAVDAARIAREATPRRDLAQRMQGIVLLGVFLRILPSLLGAGRSAEDVLAGAERAVRKYFGRRGEAVVQANLQAIRKGHDEVVVVREGGHGR